MKTTNPQIKPTETEMQYIRNFENEHNVILKNPMICLAVMLLRMSPEDLQRAIEILKRETI